MGQTVNSIKGILTKYDPKLAKSLAGFNSLDVQSITKTVLGMSLKGKQAALAGQLLNRALAISPNLASTIRSMDAEIKGKLTTGMMAVGTGVNGTFNSVKNSIVSQTSGVLSSAKNGLFPDEVNQIGTGSFSLIDDPKSLMCTVDGVETTIGVEKYAQTTSMAELVNSVTGKNTIEFKDVGGEAAFHTAIVKESLNSNVSGVTKDIFSVISDRQVMQIVSREVMPDIVKYSSVDDLYNVSSNLGDGDLIGATPNLLNIFSRNFGNHPDSKYNTYGASSAKHVATYEELIRAYDTAYPGWSNYTRVVENEAPETTVNISPLIGGTTVFNSILKTGATATSDVRQKAYLLAPVARDMTVEQMLAMQYPRTKFYFDTQVSKVKDPRTLNKI